MLLLINTNNCTTTATLLLSTKNTYKRPLMNNNFKNILYLQEKKVNEKGIILLRLLWQYWQKQQQNTLILPKSK
jgi:hypothetical protein